MAVARIQIRRDTASNWTTANTILTEGELGYETDTRKAKIGNGTSAWNSLPYLIYSLGFSDLASTPNTIAGYGITDAFDGVFSSLTSKPTTIAGYGITDAFNGAFSSLTGTPTTLAGYGITDSFNGAFSSLTGTPTTLAGYGITNAAPLASPNLTGTPTAPTAATATNTTQIATTAFVERAINNVVDSAPGALDTLNELAAALGDDASFSTTVTNSLATKAPLASPALTGTPTAPTATSGTNTTQVATTAFVQTSTGTKSSLTDFSVNTASASGSGALSYNNSSGVFTFTPPVSFDGVFSSLSGKPATIAGYGITDAFNGVFSSLTSRPTTIAGYGITDAFDGVFSSLTSRPTTIAGYGITDAFDGAFSSLSGKPTTVSGYGITNALTTGADVNIGSYNFITTGKAYFANMFAAESDLPSATTYHGMFAHVHATGAGYFAHAGNWVKLANNSDVTTKAPLASPALTGTPTAPTATSGTNTTQIATTAFVQAAAYTDSSVDTHLNTSTASNGEVLSWTGSDYDWVAQSGGGGGGGGGASVTTSDSAPSSPSAGDLWYNTDAGGLFVYYTDADSSQWVEVVGKTGPTGAAGGSTITVSDAAPSSPVAGQLWWNSTSNKLYIYYTDANSSQWVQATTPGADGADGATGATGATGAAGADGASSGRNKFINGNFDVWQRGTSRTTSGFASDRWRLGIIGNSQATFSQQSFTLGQTEVPFNPRFYQRAVVTAGSDANSYVLFNQRIENVRTFQGETVTVSFWAKADAAKDFALEPYQFFGTGGSPSAAVPITPQTITLSTTWTKYTKTFSIPSITGKTLGTDPNSSWLGFFFWLDAGSNWNSRAGSLGNQSGTFDFAQIQVETGTTATDFETEALGITVEKCQRYFVTLGVAGSGYATGNNQTASAVATVTLPTRMRAVPTVTANITQGALTNTGAALTTFNFYNTGGGLGATSTGSGRQWWGALVEFNAET